MSVRAFDEVDVRVRDAFLVRDESGRARLSEARSVELAAIFGNEKEWLHATRGKSGCPWCDGGGRVRLECEACGVRVVCAQINAVKNILRAVGRLR
jgi:hypothetical protein